MIAKQTSFGKTVQKGDRLLNKKLIAGISAAVVVGVLCAAEFGGAYYFRNHYTPNTTINGVNVSGKSMDSAKQALDNSLNSYTLTWRLRFLTSVPLNGLQTCSVVGNIRWKPAIT